MPPAQLAYAAYRNAEVGALTQRDLIVKLYQGAERFLIQGRLGIENRDREMKLTGCHKAKAIFIELCSTLNFEKGGEVATRLRDLYLFFIDRITRASLQEDASYIAAILPMISDLRTAWQSVPDAEANTSSLPSGHEGTSFDCRR